MFHCCISKEEKRHPEAFVPVVVAIPAFVPTTTNTVQRMSEVLDKQPKDNGVSGSLHSVTSISHSSLLRESKDDVYKKYEILEVLGQGSMGAVSKGKDQDEDDGLDEGRLI
jgi:hypothetical protein